MEASSVLVGGLLESLPGTLERHAEHPSIRCGVPRGPLDQHGQRYSKRNPVSWSAPSAFSERGNELCFSLSIWNYINVHFNSFEAMLLAIRRVVVPYVPRKLFLSF